VAGNRGLFLFYTLAICMLAAIFSVAPAVAASAISSERENETFELLLLAGGRARSIVFGKLIAAVLFVALLACTVIPGFAVAWMFGGVSARDVALSLALLLATILFISAVGLFFSAVASGSTLASLYTYAVVYLLALGSLMAYVVGASTQNEALVRPLLSLNPFVALITIPETMTGNLQLVLPFQYRPALDSSSQEWLGLSLRYPRWVPTLVTYLLGTVVLAVLTAFVLDPCHRLKTRERVRA
jgi:ABC-type transport system involved in multi-copper enzyme maturation permease subunit